MGTGTGKFLWGWGMGWVEMGKIHGNGVGKIYWDRDNLFYCVTNPVFKVTAFLKSNISEMVRLMDKVTIAH